jgi:NodT family efflux transporter outer membrane factor (OMF) lipoprotein
MGLAAALALSACAAVGPNFRAPDPPNVSGYAAPGDKDSAVALVGARAAPAGPWWRALGSPALDAVMKRALEHNQTVAVAEATLERVRALAKQESAARGPDVAANADYQRERINIAALGFPNFPSPTIGLFSIGPTVSYDLDLAGGERRRIETAKALVRAESFRADAAYLALTGDVALEAATIAALRAQIDGVQAVVDDDRQSIAILRAAEGAGGGAHTAALGGELRLGQDMARLPPLDQRLAEARHALTLLSGDAPGDGPAFDFALDAFSPPDSIPVALPSVLVRRRPDIQAAEAYLHADTARVGVADAARYPDVRLVAGITQEALTPGSLFGFGATAYNFGPQVTAPIFDGGAARSGRDAALAQARASLANYRQTVLTAFTQVSDVLSALAQDDTRLAALGRAEAVARANLDAARGAYRLGGAPLASVVLADREWREASLDRIDAVGRRLADIIALYGATAADWRAIPEPGHGQ